MFFEGLSVLDLTKIEREIKEIEIMLEDFRRKNIERMRKADRLAAKKQQEKEREKENV